MKKFLITLVIIVIVMIGAVIVLTKDATAPTPDSLISASPSTSVLR